MGSKTYLGAARGYRTGLVSGEGTLYLISGLLSVGMRTGEYWYPTERPQGGTSGMTHWPLAFQMAIIYEKIPEYGGVVIKELR